MQTYDQKYFDAKANRRAGTTWIILMFIVTIFYGVKMGGGELRKQWFIVFTAIGWFEYFVAGVMLRVRPPTRCQSRNEDCCFI